MYITDMVCSSVGAAVTECHRWTVLRHRNVFFTVLQVTRAGSMCLWDRCLVRSLFLTCEQCFHAVSPRGSFSVWGERERELSGASSSSNKDASPIKLGSRPYAFVLPFSPPYRPCLQIVTLGGELGLRHLDFGRIQFSPNIRAHIHVCLLLNSLERMLTLCSLLGYCSPTFLLQVLFYVKYPPFLISLPLDGCLGQRSYFDSMASYLVLYP